MGAGGSEGVGEDVARLLGTDEQETRGFSVPLAGQGCERFDEGFSDSLRGDELRRETGAGEGASSCLANGGDAWGDGVRWEATAEDIYCIRAGEDEPMKISEMGEGVVKRGEG